MRPTVLAQSIWWAYGGTHMRVCFHRPTERVAYNYACFAAEGGRLGKLP